MRYYDLRAGFVPLPPPGLGFDPAGDALHLFPAGTSSPARSPVPGTQLLDSLGPGQRFVVRVPDDWNGDLIAAGTPATRSEFANDAIAGDFALARGYAFVSSNKGIPYNAVAETAYATPDPALVYPVPFEANHAREAGVVVRFGPLWPHRIGIRQWHEDLALTIQAAKAHVLSVTGRAPKRTFAFGLSNGGGQVRWLLERRPDLVDGGVEWASVYWSPDENILTYLPRFCALMPAYVRSRYTDRDAHDAIVAEGFPPDRTQPDARHPSLWNDHFANIAPHYADVTTFLFAKLLEPDLPSFVGHPPNVANPVGGERSAGPTNATGFALPEARAAYRPSAEAKKKIAEFAHTGDIQRPLVGIAGAADVFITPQHNAAPYFAAVHAAGRGALYRQYLVADGPHVDAYATFGYGLRAQLPFAWRAFDVMLALVDGARPPHQSAAATVVHPAEMG